MLHYQVRRLTNALLLGLVGSAVVLFGATDVVVQGLIQATIAVLGAVWAIRKFRRPYGFVWSSLYVPLGLIVLVLLAQRLSGMTTATGGLTLWMSYLGFLVLAVNVQADATLRAMWPRGAIILGFIVGISGLLQAVLMGESVFGRPVRGLSPFGLFADAEHFAVCAELLFPLALATALETRRRPLLALSATALLAATAAATSSRTGFLLLTAEFVVILMVETVTLVRRHKERARRIVSSVGALSLVAGVLIAGAVIGELDPTRSHTARPASASVRANAVELFWNQPLLGSGFGSFATAFRESFPLEPNVDLSSAEPVRLAVELGIGGVVAQVLFIGLLPILARTRQAWLGGVLPLAAAWIHSWDNGSLASPALVLIALGLGAYAAADGASREWRRLRPRAPRDASTESSQNQSPQREYQVISSE